MKNITLTLLFSSFILASAHAKDTLRSVDATNFDIAGVKLGMSSEEASSALLKTLKIKKDKLNVDSISRATGKPPRSIQVFLGKNTYTVFFGENIYDNKSPTIVTAIQLTGSPSNLAGLKSAVIKKYGLPSGDSMALMADAVWCKTPGNDSYFTCSKMDEPVLKLSRSELWFSNRAYDKDYIKFQQKKNKKSTPKL